MCCSCLNCHCDFWWHDLREPCRVRRSWDRVASCLTPNGCKFVVFEYFFLKADSSRSEHGLVRRDDRKQLCGIQLHNVQFVHLTSACWRDRGRGGRRPGRQTFCAFAVLIRLTGLGKSLLFSLSVVTFICVLDIFSLTQISPVADEWEDWGSRSHASGIHGFFFSLICDFSLQKSGVWGCLACLYKALASLVSSGESSLF